MHEIMTPKCSCRWRRVGIGDIDVYLPQNIPIEALGRTLVFREAESRVEAIAPMVEGENAGVGAGDRDEDDGGDGDVDLK